MFLSFQAFELQLVRLGIPPKALKRGRNMSYIHDLTTTALNLIDAKNSLEYGGSSPASLSERTVLTDVLEILNRCEPIPSGYGLTPVENFKDIG